MSPSKPGSTPGSPEPLDGKCGAKLKGFNNPEDPRYQRYCTQPAGKITNHVGKGRCALHGGASPNHNTKWARVEAQEELTKLEQMLDKPPSNKPIEVRMWELAGELGQFHEATKALGRQALLEGADTTDRAGIEHTKAKIELYERSADRLVDMYSRMQRFELGKKILELSDKQGQAILEVMRGTILSSDLALTDEQVDIALKLVFAKLAKVGTRLEPEWMPELSAHDIYDAEIVEDGSN